MTISSVQDSEISQSERVRMFNIVHAGTHSDFKGTYNGEKTVLSHAKYGFGLVSARSISNAELLERYSYMRRKK